MTKVLARPNAARKSPPVWRLTSPRCHFHAMHSKSFGIHDAEITVHEVYDEIVHGRKAQCFMLVLLNLRAPTHYRPHFGVAQHAFPYVGRRCVETIVKIWVGGDRLDQGFREKENRGWCSWRCQRWARGVSPCRGIVQPMSREEADRRIEALRHEIALALVLSPAAAEVVRSAFEWTIFCSPGTNRGHKF